MDNIQDKIAEIMSDPQALKQVQSLGKMLGLDNSEKINSQSLGSLENIFGNSSDKPEPKNNVSLNDGVPTEMMTKIVKIMPLLRQVNQEDDVSRLLQALRPFLSKEKCQKLESAKKILQVMKIIPLLKEGGLIETGFL